VNEATAQGAASAQCKISAQDKRSCQVDEEDASENSMSQEKIPAKGRIKVAEANE
jgi:hypothetical protein